MPISCGRTLVVTIGKALSVFWLLSLLHLSSHRAQELPSDNNIDPVPNHEQEIFDNSHLLSKERENSVYLYKGEPTEKVFTLARSGTMTIVVTPCGSRVHWSLRVRRDLPRGYRLPGQHEQSRDLMYNSYNDARQPFYEKDAPVGSYTLRLNSTDSDSIPTILISRNTTLHYTYPQLPSDTSIHTKVRKRKLTVTWSPSPMANHLPHPVQYCVSISQIKNFKTHCSALAHKNGDKKPSYNGWGFPSDERRAKENRNKARPIRKVKKKHLFYECVKGKTSFTYKKFRKGKKYFVDVFIVNEFTKASSAYTGTTVEKKKNKRVQKKHYAVLNMDKTRTVNLKHTRGVQINVNNTLNEFVIEVVPCGDETLNLKVKKGHKELQESTPVKGWKRLRFENVTAGTYLIAFPGKRRKSSFVSLSASSARTSKFDFPEFKNMTVHSGLTSCSHVTLEWMEAKGKQYYCLYKRVVPNSKRHKNKGGRRQRCLSPAERPRSERVFCKHRGSSKRQRRRPYIVRGLAPGKTYRFDLYVGNKNSGMVAYQSLKETTKSNC